MKLSNIEATMAIALYEVNILYNNKKLTKREACIYFDILTIFNY